jgi:hypothetical protein
MANELLKRALAEQEERLGELDAKLIEMVPLQQERNNVHTLVSQMRFTLGLGPYPGDKIPAPDMPPSKDAPTQPAPAPPLQPIWQVAKAVVEQAGHPLSPGEIADMLRGLGFKTLEGRSGREIVRSVLNKKKNVFQKLDGGKFAVRNTLL